MMLFARKESIMFWDLIHFYPPLGEWGLLLFMLAIAVPVYFIGRALGKKPKIKKVLTWFFVISVCVMDVLYNFRINPYPTYFSNLILIPVAVGLLISWINLPKKLKFSNHNI
jgi:RsiW-degrading membrane proteinase PrsW (M82 family)